MSRLPQHERAPKDECAYPSATASMAAPVVVAPGDARAAKGLDVKLALLGKARARRQLARLPGLPAPARAHVQALQRLSGELVEEVVLLVHLLAGGALLLHLWLDFLQARS